MMIWLLPSSGNSTPPLDTSRWEAILKPFYEKGMNSWKTTGLINDALQAVKVIDSDATEHQIKVSNCKL